MKRALVDKTKCLNCVQCAVEQNCDVFAVIREVPEDIPWIDFFKCRGCLKCKKYCKGNAISEETQPCNMGMRQTW